MEEFIKQFRDNLEKRAEPPFEERDWQDIAQRLDNNRDKKKGAIAWAWLILLLLLLLSGSNAFMYVELSNIRKLSKNHLVQTDTIIIAKVIYKTDTIYQPIQNIAANTFAPNEVNLMQFYPSLPGRIMSAVEKAAVWENDTPNEGYSMATDKKTQAVVLHELSPAKSISLSDPELITDPFLPIVGLTIKTVHNERQPQIELGVDPLPVKRKKSNAISLLKQLAPDGIQAGMHGGWLMPLGEEVDWFTGITAGLQMQVILTPGIQIWLDGRYGNIRYESATMDASIGIPWVNSPADGFVFLIAEVPQPFVQYSAGLTFNVLKNKKSQPYIGFGYGIEDRLPYEITYDFRNDHLGAEWISEQKGMLDKKPGHFLMARVGYETRLSRHWLWQIGADYRANVKQNGFSSPDAWGLHTTLFYRFGKKRR